MSTVLRSLLGGSEVVVVPNAHDALTARLIARAGFKATVIGEGLLTNALLGQPGTGLLTLTEVEFITSRVTESCSIPVIVNLHGDRGGVLNIVREGHILERAGAAAIQITDQSGEGRSGDVAGTEAVSIEEMEGKIKALLDNRRDPDFMVIARSDSALSEGVEGAIERIEAYARAGADGVLAIGFFSDEDMRRIANAAGDTPQFASFYHSTPSRPVSSRSLDEYKAIGVRAIFSGVDVLRAATLGMQKYLDELQARGIDGATDFEGQLVGSGLEDWQAFMGFAEIRELERKYLPGGEVERRYGRSTDGYMVPDTAAVGKIGDVRH